MGGAFVAVADDATAVYWNPAGLASGPYASVVVDWQTHEARQTDDTSMGAAAHGGSATFFGLTTPPLGLAYYRLRSSEAGLPALGGSDGNGQAALRSLVTHHWAATLVQTVVEGLTVAASVKLVRGVAADGLAESDRAFGELVDEAARLGGRGKTRADVDVGVLAVVGPVRVGVVGRHLAAPAFETPAGRTLSLDRHVRAGVAVTPTDRMTFAFDADLLRTDSPAGERRMVAAGGETWWLDRRLALRAGLRANTLNEARPAGAAGISVALFGGFWVEAQVTRGGDDADRSWGLSARVGF